MRINGNTIPLPVLLASMLIAIIGSGFLSPIVSYTAPTAFAATNLKGDELKGKVVTSSGKPVSGAHVQLFSPGDTMMDLTTTGNDGKYTLDLGVLEESEMKKLNEFSVVVSKDGKKVIKVLDSGASSSKDIVNLENITLP